MFEDSTSYAPFKLFEYDHNPGNFCLMISDHGLGAFESAFAEGGREPNGYGCTDVALQLLRTHAPELEEQVGFDPEAGMFVAYGSDLASLQKLGAILIANFRDTPKLIAAVKAAPYEYD